MNNMLSLAIRCFSANLEQYGNNQAKPENHNLYKGLVSLAEGIAQIETQVQNLELQMRTLATQIQSPKDTK